MSVYSGVCLLWLLLNVLCDAPFPLSMAFVIILCLWLSWQFLDVPQECCVMYYRVTVAIPESIECIELW